MTENEVKWAMNRTMTNGMNKEARKMAHLARRVDGTRVTGKCGTYFDVLADDDLHTNGAMPDEEHKCQRCPWD